MKVKHILAVGAAGVTLLGASTLLASISDELTVYASQNTTENPNPENFRSTQWRYRDKSNIPLTFKYAEKYSGEPGEFAEFTYVKSYSDGGVWVHEFALKAGATPPASNDNTYVNTNSTGRNNTDHVDSSDTNSSTNQKNEYKWLTVNGKPQLYINNNLATGWQKVDGVWYYLDGSGAMQTGWLQDGGTWYYLNSSGAMVTGWAKVGGTWYYLKGSGAMVTGWFQVGGKWYYAYSSGALAVSTTVDGYYVNANGEWV